MNPLTKTTVTAQILDRLYLDGFTDDESGSTTEGAAHYARFDLDDGGIAVMKTDPQGFKDVTVYDDVAAFEAAMRDEPAESYEWLQEGRMSAGSIVAWHPFTVRRDVAFLQGEEADDLMNALEAMADEDRESEYLFDTYGHL